MKALLAFQRHHSETHRPWHLSVFVLTCALLMIFSGSLFAGNTVFTHVPGKPASNGFANIPGKPSSRTLSHVAGIPDLTISSITFKTQKAKEKDTAWVIIKVKNIGKVTSSKTTVSALLTRGDRTRDKKSFRVKALKAGYATEVKWLIHTTPGKNVVKAAVSDSNNRQNNTLEKFCLIMVRGPGVLAHREAIKAKGARTGLSKKAGKRGILTIKEITFDDHRGKKPDETWVSIEIENRGKAVTPATSIPVEIHRADGSRKRKIFRIRALMPGESTRIEDFIKMARGVNTLEVMGIGGINRSALTTFSRASRGFTARHIFNPHLFTEIRKNNASLAKNAARASKGKTTKSEMPSGNTLKALLKEKRITLPKQVGTSTYGGEITRFLEPQPHAVLPPNQHCFIRWTWNNTQPDADTRLELHLKSVTNPKHFPELILARGLDPATRSYPWDIGNIPAGHLYTLQLYETNADTASLLASTEIKIDTPHFGVVRKTAIPNGLFVNHEVTLYADVVNTGGGGSQPFYAKVRVTGPKNFVLESRSIKIAAPAHGKSGRIHFSFKPPFPGIYKAVYELDITHKYIPATEASPEINRTFNFTVQGLPDLKVLINKVPDGVLAISRMHFHIKVVNLGTVPSPPTKVYFDLTDQDRKVFDVPSLQPVGVSGYGKTLWKHDFSKKWQSYSGGTGRKRYAVTVDPEHRIVEANEANNRIFDRFHIYRGGEPMPKHTPIPPRLVVTKVYGLPTSPIPPGTALSFLVHFKCVSPDRVPLGGRCLNRLRIMIGNTIYHENYFPINRTSLYPDETDDYYSGEQGDSFRLDSTGTHVFKIAINVPKGKHCSSGQWQTLFERPIIVRESGNQERAVQEALASKNPRPYPGKSDRSIKSITILSPSKNKIWAIHKLYQVAWTGEATGPFTVMLIPKDHPNTPVQIAENITTYATDYTVNRQLKSGLYRVKVQSENGWGISDFFAITSNSKPNLTFKAVSITNKLSGFSQKPYTIEVRFILENKGGYQTKPFNVLLECTGKEAGSFLEKAGVQLEPMLDRRTCSGRIRINVSKGGVYTLKLYADAYCKVDESNENDNTVINGRYRVKPYPDLRLSCQQAGRKLKFTVKNTGDGISGATTIKLKLKLHNSLDLPLPGWHRDGDYMVAPPIAVKSIGAGKTLKVDGPSFVSFHIHSSDTYVATVNPNRDFKELCLDNNTVVGALSANSRSRVPQGWWKTAFGVEVHCQNDTTVSRADIQTHPRILLHFGFVLWNRSELVVTPEDPPIQAVLYLKQRNRDKTFTYDVPPLFFVSRSSRRDEYRISRAVPFMASQGDVSYTLFLKNGPEGHNMVPLTSGKIKLTVTDDTCG